MRVCYTVESFCVLPDNAAASSSSSSFAAPGQATGIEIGFIKVHACWIEPQ